MAKPPAPRDDEVQNTLLGDLESIRSLLEIPTSPAVSDDSADSADVPMLEDMVDGAFTVSESVLSSRTSFDDDGGVAGASGLADETIKALLGDEWRASARRILSDARATIEDAAGARWSPQQADALNKALKVRIDDTLDDWLADVMYARIDELRSRLLALLEMETKRFTDALQDDNDHGK
jgi:hypothetical protein